MEEVVGRRYRRLFEEERPFPDLVVIDGGRGQVTAALKAFLSQGLEPPPLVGLAKKEEQVIFSDGREPLQLGAHNPARLLLQRVRDEAHRFANTYNAELRSRRLRESILDDFEGLGKVRREALFARFGSLPKLRAATREELQSVEGIGPKLAARLHTFLQEAS
jgi:excinuclease ABC subunit C